MKRISSKSTLRLSILVAAALLLAACKPPLTPSVSDVTITGGDRTIGVGATAQLSADVTATGGASEAVEWSSSDDSVVAVSEAGLITGVAAGSAQVTATSVVDSSASDTITVTVIMPDPDLDEVHVDAAAAPGGNGHPDLPFQTINEGMDAVNPGGTVHVAAGVYGEELYVTKSFNLVGAGSDSTTIVVDADAPETFSESGIDIVGVDGFTMSGFTIVAQVPGPVLAVITVRNQSNDINLSDLLIEHTNTDEDTHGINVLRTTNVTIQDVEIIPTTVGDHFGNGVRISGEFGDVTGVTLTNVTTSLHEEYAGLSLDPRDNTLTDISLQGTFNEVNKMTVIYAGTGSIVNLVAPQFVISVGNIDPYYGSGIWHFYKESVDRAIIDSLFNFTQNYAWIHSTLQMLDTTDQAIRLNHFVLGEVFDDLYGWGITRSHRIQAAVDAAEPGALLEIRAGTYGDVDEVLVPGSTPQPGNVTIDLADITLQGAGAGTIISASTGTVLTIDADEVTIQDVQIQGPAGVTGVNLTSGDNHTITGSNLLSPIALVNVASSTVDAANNWWGAADGPSGDALPPGSGGQLLAESGGVTYTPFAITPY